MIARTIKDPIHYELARERMEQLMTARAGTPAGDEFDALAEAVFEYEQRCAEAEERVARLQS